MRETLLQRVAMPYQDNSRPLPMNAQQTLSRIFAICDHVAETNQTIRTESQGKETARVFLGLPVSGGDQKVKPKEIK